jgi:asparagine synthase (glutamine-hydrolysing)
MCGICGVIDPDQPPDLDLVRSMIARLGHRGPDGHGYVRAETVALGHARLAIVDTTGGAQPMTNEDGTIWVTFNGEIFNHVELRAQLQRCGHTFRTVCDTEVIVHAWEEWGESCFDRFNGQWALALWDRPAGRVVLCRDRLGVRPLFYVQAGRRLLFASEVKALFADPTVERALDPDGLAQVLTFWSTIAPLTVFRGVRQVPPGHLLEIGRNGVQTRPYWSITFPAGGAESCQDIDANTELLRRGVTEAARLRFLRSDVPVGVYLSGGLDSSVIASVVARHSDVPLKTFSLRFSDAAYDEGEFQRQMVDKLGTDHTEVCVRPRDVAQAFPDVVRFAETVLLRAAPAPLFLLSKAAAEHGCKVVLTGEGADEVLAGYDLFRESQVRLFLSRNPDSMVRGRALELLYPWLDRSPARFPGFARSFFGRNLDARDPAVSHRPRWDSTVAVRSLLQPDLRARLDPAVAGLGDELVAAMPAASAEWDPLSRAQWLEMTTLLPGYLLSSQGDRMLMAHSVEGRFPFLDRDVVELASTLPARHKLFGLDEKHLLKRAFGDLVPADILRRPKQPYRAPDATAFFTADPPAWLADVTSSTALAAADVFDPTRVRGLFDKCERRNGVGMSNTDNMRVLAVVSTQLLHHQFLAGDPPGAGERLAQAPSVAVDLVGADHQHRRRA